MWSFIVCSLIGEFSRRTLGILFLNVILRIETIHTSNCPIWDSATRCDNAITTYHHTRNITSFRNAELGRLSAITTYIYKTCFWRVKNVFYSGVPFSHSNHMIIFQCQKVFGLCHLFLLLGIWNYFWCYFWPEVLSNLYLGTSSVTSGLSFSALLVHMSLEWYSWSPFFTFGSMAAL